MREKIASSVRVEMDRALVKRIPLSAVSHLVLIGISQFLSPIFAEVTEARVLAFTIAIVALIRLTFGFLSPWILEENRSLWIWIFRGLVGLGGLCWGLIGYLAVHTYGVEKTAVLLLLPVAGVASGAITSLYYEPAVLYVFIAVTILPCIWAEILTRNQESLSLAAMSALFLLFLTIQARTVSSTAIKALRLRHSSANEREKIQAILEALPGYISWIDTNGNYRGVNDRLARVFGLNPSDFVGKPLGFLNTGNHFSETIQTFLYSKKREDLLEFKSSGGENARWLLVALKRYRFLDQEEVIIIGIDIHDRKTAERQLEEARAASIQSSKLASLGEMAGGVAHEINNPLAIIQGKAGQLLKAAKSGEISSDNLISQLEKVSATSERIAKIVRGLRAFSRNAAHDPLVPTALSRIFDDTLSLCAERFKNHGVRIEIGEVPDLTLSCRPAQISQVLLNLLNNAYDAMDRLEDKWVKLDAFQNGDCVILSVTDAGAGIPEVVAEKLMQPFFTTKELGRGTGLGLSISKGIVEEHGGQLYLDRASSHTRFVAELPLRRPDQQGAA